MWPSAERCRNDAAACGSRLHDRIAQPFARRTDQQGRRVRTTGAIIAAQVVVQRRDGARMQRQGAGLVELAVPDRHHAVRGVEVIVVEADRLADPHAGCRQEADQGPVGRLHVRSAQVARGPHQVRDLLRRVEIRRCAPPSRRQKIGGRHLGHLVECAEVPGEEANLGQTSGVPDRGGACGPGRPGQRRRGPDMRLAAAFDEGDELAEKPLGLVHLVAEGAPHGQIIGNGLRQRAHRSPSGQGRAIRRRLSRSTLA